jgi:transcriptional regulator with XRE-family HTH domain
MTKTYPYEPDYAVPPGTTLRDTLEEKGLSQADLALRTGLAEKTISQIVNGVAPITYETAEKLELVLGVPGDFGTLGNTSIENRLFGSRSFVAWKAMFNG